MFSQKIKELRKRDELSQISFAENIGFSQAAISAWENGTREPGIEALIQIAKYFNVSLDYLVGESSIQIKNEKSPPALSAEEQELLDMYRALGTKNKLHVYMYAKLRLEEQEDYKTTGFLPRQNKNKKI